MSPEKTKILLDSFPKLFESNFYFECGDGWFDLIKCLASNIQNHVDWESKGKTQEEIEEIQPIASQVKEKFGGLRFYLNTNDDRIRGMVTMAESYSYKICEACGNKGNPYKDGWVRTHCSPCEDNWQKNRQARNGSIG